MRKKNFTTSNKELRYEDFKLNPDREKELEKIAKDLPDDDFEGALKKSFDAGFPIPGSRIISKGVKGVTGQDLFYDEPVEKDTEMPEFKKRGEVDIERAASEPDERIDKMTGMPYDQQAGTAFVDEEDPLRRMGFGKGGGVDPLRRLGFGHGGKVLNVLQNRKVSNG